MEHKDAEKVYLVYKRIADVKWEIAQIQSNIDSLTTKLITAQNDLAQYKTELEAL